MKSSCDRIAEGLKCLKAHSKCLNALAKRAVVAYVSGRSKHSKRLCADINGAKAIDFWKSADCIKSSGKQKVMIAGEKELISTFQAIAANKTMKWNDRFNGACCVASKYKVQTIKNIEPECVKYQETNEDMMNSMIGDLLDAACPEQLKLAEICNKIPKITPIKEWIPTSMTKAGLDLIVALEESQI